jgi:hypothetical protein
LVNGERARTLLSEASTARDGTGDTPLGGTWRLAMVRLFDATFVLATVLVVLALGIAFAAIARNDLPLVGTGVGALIAVGVIGMAGCAVGGISQAPMAGWTDPAIVLGIVLGVVALVVVAAGVFGWTSVLEPVSRFVPGDTATLTPARTAIGALAALIGVKWLVATVMTAVVH